MILSFKRETIKSNVFEAITIVTLSLQCNSVTTPILAILRYLYKKIAHLMPIFFGKNVNLYFAFGQFIFCLWSIYILPLVNSYFAFGQCVRLLVTNLKA